MPVEVGLFYAVLLLYNRKVLLSSANQVLPFSASAVILPPLRKSLPLGFIYPYYTYRAFLSSCSSSSLLSLLY